MRNRYESILHSSASIKLERIRLMHDNARKILKEYGYVKDENNFQLKDVLKNNSYLKEMCIDIYSEDPLSITEDFMLLLRTSEKNTTVLNDGIRIHLRKNDKYKTHILNVLISKIMECFYKIVDNCIEFVFNIQNIYYRLIVFN